MLILLVVVSIARAQESPYFVTYDHHLEEPGNLAVETSTTMGLPRPRPHEERDQSFYAAPYVELEYGITDRITSAVYMEGQGTVGDSTLFTGWRVETRFRPMKKEHVLNPVFYLEYESLNDASRIAKDIVGKGPDLDDPNSELRPSRAHELESKFIVSSDVRNWNVAGNFVVDKNLLRGEGFEFGYAFGVSKVLASSSSATTCTLCRKNFVGGLEFYGGLGTTATAFGFQHTAQYVAPTISWSLREKGTLRFSTAIGVGNESSRFLLRVGYSFDIPRLRTASGHKELP